MRDRALLIAALLLATALFAAAGCGSDDDDEPDQGESYAADVEAISDAAYEESQNALITLNRLADGSISVAGARRALEQSAEGVQRQADALRELEPPEVAALTAEDLEFQLSSVSREISSAAIDVVVGAPGSPRDAARAAGSAVLIGQSGAAALARALRRIAVEAGD